MGDALLITPVLEEGASQVVGYFPPALWYSVWDKKDVIDARYGGVLSSERSVGSTAFYASEARRVLLA